MDRKQQNEYLNSNNDRLTKKAWETPTLNHIDIENTRSGVGSISDAMTEAGSVSAP